MNILRPSRVLLLLLVAVWQLFLPFLAYAHMAKTSALTQEVCTSLGMKTIVVQQNNYDAGSQFLGHPTDSPQTSHEHHDCCIFTLNVLLSAEENIAQNPIQPSHLGLFEVPQRFISHELGLHAPPTGPPLFI